jgi:RHS repeat-associated protein
VNLFRYTARESDTETGLYYYRARSYDPNAGRFLGEDPIQFEGGANFYRYVYNSPTGFTDPLGLAQCTYSISQHTLICVENTPPPVGPTWEVQVGPNDVQSGLGMCADQPKCSGIYYNGPIPPGKYKINPDNRPGHQNWFRLEPQPIVPGWEIWKRRGFALHLGTLSLGCINVNKNSPSGVGQFQQLQQLLNSESGNNSLQVNP